MWNESEREAMNLCCTSDWHLRASTPKNRIDNFPQTQSLKLSNLLNTAWKENCLSILMGGDVFDSSKLSSVPYSLLQMYISILKDFHSKTGIPILGVFGQHDMRFHSQEFDDTPLQVLIASGVFTKLDDTPYYLDEVTHVYGASWDQEIPTPEDLSAYNILVIHRLIVQSKLWEEQEDVQYGTDFLLKHPEQYRDWETDRKSTRLNSSHSRASRMPSSA